MVVAALFVAGRFSPLDQFKSWFDFSEELDDKVEFAEREQQRRAKVISKLHGILKPFLLRRLKGDVEISLPRKKEIIVYASMTETQRSSTTPWSIRRSRIC